MVSRAQTKIDVHRCAQAYVRRLENLEQDKSISEVNKRYILEFVRACHLGKTIFTRQRKRIQEKRLLKYLYLLPRVSSWLGNEDLKKVTQPAMDRFISHIDANALTDADSQSITYSAWTRRDIKVCVKKFYKWLLGNGKQYPDLVAWIDTSITEPPPGSLSVDEIRKCSEFASTAKGKALVWTLFETGARAEEFLNIRVGHAEDKGSHFIVGIEHPKTFRRSLPVHEGAHLLRQWLAQHPSPDNSEEQLFPMGYEALLKFLRRVGMRALGKPIGPQLIRDSLATWLASKKVGRYQMCKIMGWAMSSDMPDRYINRVGVVEEDAIASIRGDGLSQATQENQELKLAVSRLESQCNSLQEQLHKRSDTDRFLSELLKDETFLKDVAQRIRASGLGEELLRL